MIPFCKILTRISWTQCLNYTRQNKLIKNSNNWLRCIIPSQRKWCWTISIWALFHNGAQRSSTFLTALSPTYLCLLNQRQIIILRKSRWFVLISFLAVP
jgi:hypothetical protein